MEKIRLLSKLPVLAICLVTLVSCAANPENAASGLSGNASGATSGSTAAAITSIADTVTYGSDDYYFDWQSQSYQTIKLGQDSPSISKSGIYEITGTLDDGSLVVDVDKNADQGTVYLVLNNAKISSTTSAPIYVKDAKKVVLVLENGTANIIYQGSGVMADDNNEPSAAVFSKADLTITGSGALSVSSDYNDGITGKDTLKITDGTLNINAKADGIVGKDVLAVEKGNITVTAGKDGIRSTNDTDPGLGNVLITGGALAITSTEDAVQAKGTLEVDGGTFDITAGGGYAQNTTVHSDNGFGGQGMGPGGMGMSPGQTAETATDTESDNGLCADGNIIISQGLITVSAYDDALNAGGGIMIKGGTLTLQSGDDGIHSDADLIIDGGTIEIKNSYEGVEGKNITVDNGKITLTSSDDGFNVNDQSGLLTINGGEISIVAGGDGLDSNGSVQMAGGTVYVTGPTDSGNGAIDYNGSFTISGGAIIAAGSSGMAQAPGGDSSQPSILMYYSTTQAAGTAITLKDSSGNPVAVYTPAKQYTSVAISSPGMKAGQSYTLYSGSTEVVTFTLADAVTYLNESGVTQNQSMGPGGMRSGNSGGMGNGNPGGWQNGNSGGRPGGQR